MISVPAFLCDAMGICDSRRSPFADREQKYHSFTFNHLEGCGFEKKQTRPGEIGLHNFTVGCSRPPDIWAAGADGSGTKAGKENS